MLIESKIGLVAPDTKSAMTVKSDILKTLNFILCLKQDLLDFREGKSIKTQKDMFVDMLKKAGKNPADFGFPDKYGALPEKPDWDN